MIDFTTKINPLRPYNRNTKKAYTTKELEKELLKSHEDDYLQNQLESDRGRIIASPALRRLQQKTQVFPLERNAAVRSRLTHSLEVQQNGRFIVKTLFKKLDSQLIFKYKLNDLDIAIESIVEMACLMHDIGNPPFGHFGEGALIDWFKKNIKNILITSLKSTIHDEELKEKILIDLQNFEGNAQAIRLVYSLQIMNLTFSQSASIVKYTRPAWVLKDKEKDNYLKKKAGYYLSEQNFIENMKTALSMDEGCRHPTTYIMEAADDIAYCFADIEDAVDKGIISVKVLRKLILKIFKQPKKVTLNIIEKPKIIKGNINSKDFKGNRSSLKEIINYAYERYENEDINKNHEFFIWLKVGLIHSLIAHATQRFIDNIEEIYHGNLDCALMEDGSPFHNIVLTFKEIGYKHVFNDKEVHTMEIKGFQIITGLLNHYKCLLEMPADEFNKIINNKKSDYIFESRLIGRIGNKYIKSYQEALKIIKNIEPYNLPLWEFYYRNRIIQDHISGMNDQYALDEYRLLNVT